MASRPTGDPDVHGTRADALAARPIALFKSCPAGPEGKDEIVARRKKEEELVPDSGARAAAHLEHIDRLLALIAVKDKPQVEKITTLAAVGYPPVEIAALIGTTANTVSVTLSQHKNARKGNRDRSRRVRT
jgi:hypothetical protein